jgi:hypothetical protein
MKTPPDYRPEPEIIPPGVPLRSRSDPWPGEMRNVRYVNVRPIGPIGVALLTLGIGAVAGLGLLFLLGAAVIGLLAVGVLTVAGVIAGILRGPPRSLR